VCKVCKGAAGKVLTVLVLGRSLEGCNGGPGAACLMPLQAVPCLWRVGSLSLHAQAHPRLPQRLASVLSPSGTPLGALGVLSGRG